MSDDIASIALAFCKECLGWKDAVCAATAETVNCIVERPHAECQGFDFNDLNRVMSEVKAWCERYELTLLISWDNEKWQAVIVKVPRGFPSFAVGDCTSEDLRVALLTATVNAERKAKAQDTGN